MSERPTDGGENHENETYVAYSGRCRLRDRCDLITVAPDDAYILLRFEAGEEHQFDRLQWRNKDGSHGGGFVIRTADGDAHLMGHLFERHCEVIGEPAKGAAPPKSKPVQPPRAVRVVNVTGKNKPEQRTGIVYVGRKFAGWPEHELRNPYKPRAGEPVGACIERYRRALAGRLTLEDDLAALWLECGHGKLPLGCWCVDARAGDGSEVVCHAQVLAEMLHERFSKE